MKVSSKARIDRIVGFIFLLIGLNSSSTIIFIVTFVLIKGITPFFKDYGVDKVTIIDFLIGLNFDSHSYGVLGLVINTLFIVLIVSLIALPISVLTSLFIVRIAPKKIKVCMKMVIEMLSSIPSIIIGLFGMGVINPLVRDIAFSFNKQTAGGVSLLSVIIILVIMIVPTITMISITSMESIKNDQIEASIALGATKSQTDYKIVIGSSKRGIFSGLILGVGRALGEATAVSMVCGGNVGIAISLFDPTSTLTSAMLSGIHESSGLNYDIRFSVAIVLMAVIFITNLILNSIKKRIISNE